MDETLPGIRQSDMGAYRKCRRYWDYTSALRQNLQPGGQAIIHFWFGTGMHFALEDFHGFNRFGDPRHAFAAYVEATPEAQRPPKWEEYAELAPSMLAYYLESWLPQRSEYDTLWVAGKPQLEVSWKLPLAGLDHPVSGTFDRLVTDPYGRLWIMDWKMMATIETAKLDNDFQVTTYLWAAEQLYGKVEGLIYVQFKKVVPRGPEWLEKSGRFSMATSAPVSYGSFVASLKHRFGTVPSEYQAHLNKLAMLEDGDGDLFIRRTLVRRNRNALTLHGQHVTAQAREMTYPHLAIYPNPTKDCGYCPFRAPCLAADDGADEAYLLQENFVSRNTADDWRDRIKWPAAKGGDVNLPAAQLAVV